jgi:hypothetical protein
MEAAWYGVEWGGASSTKPARHGAARDRVGRPEASAAPGSRYAEALTLPRLSSKRGNNVVLVTAT